MTVINPDARLEQLQNLPGDEFNALLQEYDIKDTYKGVKKSVKRLASDILSHEMGWADAGSVKDDGDDLLISSGVVLGVDKYGETTVKLPKVKSPHAGQTTDLTDVNKELSAMRKENANLLKRLEAAEEVISTFTADVEEPPKTG